MNPNRRKIKAFQNKVLDFYAQHGRHDLPWRKKTRTPYQVLVSEVMLQQTQVDRVISFFKNWMKLFPHFKALAQAKQSEVLRAWKGLGYNSRALRLQKLARVVTQEYGGCLPCTRAELEALPGVGPYTAGAVRVFAFGQSEVFIETNIRRVFIHEFFQGHGQIHDSELLSLIKQTLPPEGVFEWYSGLMDYGSTLPKILKTNPNTKSRHYTRQSKFDGSDRQIRGLILELLLEKGFQFEQLKASIEDRLGRMISTERFENIVDGLREEGFLRGQVRLTLVE